MLVVVSGYVLIFVSCNVLIVVNDNVLLVVSGNVLIVFKLRFLCKIFQSIFHFPECPFS